VGGVFGAEERFPGVAERIAGAEPDEMEQLMDEDAREVGARAIQGDAALAQKRAGVNGAAMVAESEGGFDADGRSGEWREAAQEGAERGGVGGEEDGGICHGCSPQRRGDAEEKPRKVEIKRENASSSLAETQRRQRPQR
jgi:hypothetical protein